jgi:hypothetical protein
MGDAIITAESRVGNTTRSGSREVIVQPAGTFRLVGTIGEVGFAGMLVPDARVEVESGSQFAITNGLGQFRLYGVPAAADIRVSANGYETSTFSVALAGNATRKFDLTLIEPRQPVIGGYTIFIDALSCPNGSPSPVPAEFQHRIYGAEVTQNGNQIDVKLNGGQFRTNSINKGDRFSGTVQAGGVIRFSFDWYDSYYYPFYGPDSYPSVAERLPDGRYLVFSGQANVTGTASTGFQGAFTGSPGIFIWDSNFPSFTSNLTASCYNGSITLKILPR